MPGVSQREVARQLGVAHGTLQFAAKSGRIAPEADGTWDTEKVRAGLQTTADPARRTAALGAAPLRPAKTSPRPDYHIARAENEQLKAEGRALQLAERRGQLINKKRVLLQVHRLAADERDAIMAWPARVAAEIAAELGVEPHRLQMLLDAKLRQHLVDRTAARVVLG